MWVAFHLAVAGLLITEYGLHRLLPDPRRKAIAATCMWIAAALLVALALVPHFGRHGASQYLAGYALEQALSADNLFVFLVLFRLLGIRDNRQPKVLFWGVLGAILLRGGFILGGVALLNRFHWISYIFAVFILIAAVRLVLPGDDQPDELPSWIRWISRVRPVSTDQSRFITREDGRRMITVLFLALLAVEVTDVVFALDSIPAVLSITRTPFLAYASNIMAVMNLRSLYVLLAAALARLRYLHYGLAATLAFAGLKMLLADRIEIAPLVSLAIIAALLIVPVLASLRGQKTASSR